MPKTYRIPHYVVSFKSGSPKTKGFEDRDEMLRFLAGTRRGVSGIKINGAKQAQSTIATLLEISKQKQYSDVEKCDFPQIALSVEERATDGKIT